VAHDTLIRPRLDSLHALVATVGGIGLLPIAPGTWCSFIVAAPVVVLPWLGITIEHDSFRVGYLVLALCLLPLSMWSITGVQRTWGTDPKNVVIDEAIGMAIILGLPFAYHTVWWWLASVLLFRVFDVQKPWPLSAINRRTEAWAVIADDVLAAVFTVLTLYAMLLAMQVVILGGAAYSATP